MLPDRLAAALAALALLLRIWTPASLAGTGGNLLLHLLPWAGLAAWAAGRGLQGDSTWRRLPVHGPLLALAALGAGSVLNASFRLPALEAAGALLSHLALSLLLAQVCSRQALATLLLPAAAAVVAYALVQRWVLFPDLAAGASPGTSDELGRRILTLEVFSTFGGPNQLAGFLVLVLPLAAGAALDAPPRVRLALGILLAAGLLAAAFTGSLGGWVALGAATLALAVLRLVPKPALLAGGAALALLAGTWLSAAPLPDALKASHSLHVRDAYWTATRAMIARSPIAGVGLDQWQEHYFGLKGDVQQETRKAHNDWLQVLAELGPAGLLAFLALFAAAFHAGFAPRPEDPSPAPHATPDLILAALAFLATAFFGGAVPAVIGAFLAGVWWVTRRALRDLVAGQGLRHGALAGLAGFAMHLLVDYDFSEPGTACAAVAVLTLLGLDRPAASPLPRRAALAVSLALAALVLPGILWLVPTASAAGAGRAAAERALETGATTEAVRLFEAARGLNPLDPEIPRGLALARRSLPDADAAIALRPRSSPLHHLRSRILREQGRIPEALEAQRAACLLYPTYSGNAYSLARLLEASGQAGDARVSYAEALRLSDLAAKELENLERLQLPPVSRARALLAVGRGSEAPGVLHAALRRLVEGVPAAEARRRLEAWGAYHKEERDARLSPVIQDALAAILGTLK